MGFEWFNSRDTQKPQQSAKNPEQEQKAFQKVETELQDNTASIAEFLDSVKDSFSITEEETEALQNLLQNKSKKEIQAYTASLSHLSTVGFSAVQNLIQTEKNGELKATEQNISQEIYESLQTKNSETEENSETKETQESISQFMKGIKNVGIELTQAQKQTLYTVLQNKTENEIQEYANKLNPWLYNFDNLVGTLWIQSEVEAVKNENADKTKQAKKGEKLKTRKNLEKHYNTLNEQISKVIDKTWKSYGGVAEAIKKWDTQTVVEILKKDDSVLQELLWDTARFGDYEKVRTALIGLDSSFEKKIPLLPASKNLLVAWVSDIAQTNQDGEIFTANDGEKTITLDADGNRKLSLNNSEYKMNAPLENNKYLQEAEQENKNFEAEIAPLNETLENLTKTEHDIAQTINYLQNFDEDYQLQILQTI